MNNSNTNTYGNWYDKLVGKSIVEKKYLHEGETNAFDLAGRVSSMFSADIKDKLHSAILNADFLPAGRILYAAGSEGKFKASYSNCYVMDAPSDDLESIFETCKKIARTFSLGGGVGLRISSLRPNGAIVRNSAKTSTGAVSFMDIFNSIGEVVGSNNRRAALLLALDCWHPDIEEFLDIKQNNDKLQSANISILFTDEFMQAVLDNKEYELHLYVNATGEEIKKTINAKDFFYKFCEKQRDWAEPSALWKDRLDDHNLLSGYPKDIYHIDCVNPCVSGDTLILTKDGYKPIASIVNKPTTIWNGYEWSDVLPKVTGHNQPMKLVKLSNGMEIKCTTYHKFIMADNSRKHAEDLVVGDKLRKWTYPVLFGSKNLEDAYTHGFYSGDGTKNMGQICLYGEKKELLKYLSVISYSDQPNQHRIAVKIAENKYKKDFVPNEEYDIKSRLEWLAGIVDSDGCSNDETGSISISSVNLRFLKDLQIMLSSLGCHSCINVLREAGMRQMPKNDGTGEYKDYECQTSYRLTISASYVKDLVKLGFQTHRVKFKAYPNRYANKFITITDVIDIPNEETVYCVNEPKNHSVVFNGIMTGNCAEFSGNAYNSCCLGSINLYNCIDNPFTENAALNERKFKDLINLGISTLDEVLDIGYNNQPLDENRKCIDDWRSVGLGLFGIADALVALGMRYGSDKSIKFIGYVTELMMKQALERSVYLAKEKGTFGKYDWQYVKESNFVKALKDNNRFLYDLIKKYGLRNGSLLSIAPGGSISTMCGCTGGVEPIYEVSYERTTHALEKTGQTFKVFSLSVEHLLKHNNIDPNTITVKEIKERFPYVVDTYDIEPSERIDFQAAMQENIDNAISSTINLRETATVEDIYNTYIRAWSMGCKGITVFRDNCARISILGKEKTKVDEKPVLQEPIVKPTLNTLTPLKRGNIKSLWGRTWVFKTACVRKLYVTVNLLDDDIFEVFVGADTGCQANINTITRLTSYALRLGGKVEDIIAELNSAICPACVNAKKSDPTINKSCASCIADALKEMTSIVHKGKNIPIEDMKVSKIEPVELKMIKTDDKVEFLECPDCHQKTLRPEGRCFTCNNCGWSRCG